MLLDQGPKWLLKMLAHSNTRCTRDIVQEISGKLNLALKKRRALNFLIPGARMALKVFGLFQPLHQTLFMTGWDL